MTTAFLKVWKLRKASRSSLKLLKRSKWKPTKASEISLNSLTLLKENYKMSFTIELYLF